MHQASRCRSSTEVLSSAHHPGILSPPEGARQVAAVVDSHAGSTVHGFHHTPARWWLEDILNDGNVNRPSIPALMPVTRHEGMLNAGRQSRR